MDTSSYSCTSTRLAQPAQPTARSCYTAARGPGSSRVLINKVATARSRPGAQTTPRGTRGPAPAIPGCHAHLLP